MNEEIIFETTLKEISEGMSKAYENWAKRAGYNVTDKTVFDCRMVEVSKEIDDYFWKYYRDQAREKNKNIAEDEITRTLAMTMLCYGAKRNENLKKWTVKLSKEFAKESED